MNLAQRELAARCKGRTHTGVAREIGVSRSFLGRVLKGRKAPGPRVLAWLGLEEVVTYRRARGAPRPAAHE